MWKWSGLFLLYRTALEGLPRVHHWIPRFALTFLKEQQLTELDLNQVLCKEWILMSLVIIFVLKLLAVPTDQERQEKRRVFLPPIASLGLPKGDSYSISFPVLNQTASLLLFLKWYVHTTGHCLLKQFFITRNVHPEKLNFHFSSLVNSLSTN